MARPVAVLVTDFGVSDDYAGLLHARLAALVPEVRVIDLTHAIPPGDIRLASFILYHDRIHFPDGTLFIAVVDPGVGTARRILYAKCGGCRFIAPDNGMLDPLIDASAGDEVWHIDEARLDTGEVSKTFHGRDLFIPAAAHILADGAVEEIAKPATRWARFDWRPAKIAEGRALGRIVHIDRFGNLITDIEIDPVDQGFVRVAGNDLHPVRTFADLPAGMPGWLRGSKGTIEIVMNCDSAAVNLGIGIDREVFYRSAEREPGGTPPPSAEY